MNSATATYHVGELAKAVVRRNTQEVQSEGNFDLFEDIFADDFLDHTPQPGRSPNKAGAREFYHVLLDAVPDFRIAPTGREIQFETVDAMRTL